MHEQPVSDTSIARVVPSSPPRHRSRPVRHRQPPLANYDPHAEADTSSPYSRKNRARGGLGDVQQPGFRGVSWCDRSAGSSQKAPVPMKVRDFQGLLSVLLRYICVTRVRRSCYRVRADGEMGVCVAFLRAAHSAAAAPTRPVVCRPPAPAFYQFTRLLLRTCVTSVLRSVASSCDSVRTRAIFVLSPPPSHRGRSWWTTTRCCGRS